MRVFLLLCLIALTACSTSKSAIEYKVYFQNADKKYVLADIDVNNVLIYFGESFKSKEGIVILENQTIYSYNLIYKELGLTFLIHSDAKMLESNRIVESIRPKLNAIAKVKEVRITNPKIETNLEVKIGDSRDKAVEKYGSYTTPWGSQAYGNENVDFSIDETTGMVNQITLIK